jgi:hypothetical protein
VSPASSAACLFDFPSLRNFVQALSRIFRIVWLVHGYQSCTIVSPAHEPWHCSCLMDPSVLEYLRAAAAAHKAAQSNLGSRLGSLASTTGVFAQHPPRPPSVQGLNASASGQEAGHVFSGLFPRPPPQPPSSVGLQKTISLNAKQKGNPHQ